ncbi:hypothetical protein DENSPDRAFT_843474 [Dentipellis sp. KUC8613]|nr:hypothetical protein DENSPDRAFT_843474 [Dentipellis sp. KUC8613]
MAYPNSSGGLPHYLYTDMSSVHISPRAGRANASPYPQTPYLATCAESPRMSLPPDLYNGMSSMRVSSPFQTHASLSPVAMTPFVDAPIDQKASGTYHPSSHMDTHKPYNEYIPIPARNTYYQYRELTTKATKAEATGRSSRKGTHQPASAVGNILQGKTTASSLAFVKSEETEPEEIDWFDFHFPESSRIGLQAVLDEKRARDQEGDECITRHGALLQTMLAERPNDPALLKCLEEHQVSLDRIEHGRAVIRDVLTQEWQWREKDKEKRARRRGH